MEKKLHRDEHRKVVGGVCAGLAEYFDIDVSIVRLVFLLSLLLKGGGGLIYIVLWIVLPKRGYLPPVDYTVPPAGTPPYQAPGTYASAAPYEPAPVFIPKKGPSTGALIGGIILILLGAGFLLDQFEIIPDFDFSNWWPVILIVIGLVFIFTSGGKNRPATKPWETTTPPTAVKTEEVKDPNNNPSTEL